MYGGLAKEGGAVVGLLGNDFPSIDVGDAQDATGAEESLICMDEEGKELALIAQLDPDTGDVEWVPTYDVDIVKSKTVAMSQMTSMLRDSDRNALYEEALKIAIESYTSKHQKAPVVLDIGAGTGLLSLFAAKNGAEAVYGVEMFDSLAGIAERVVAANALSDRICMVNAKSTAIEAFPSPPDILVSEILDSALLGESVLPSHGDAIRRLLCPCPGPAAECSEHIIPNRADVHCTLLESSEVHSKVSVQRMRCGREHLNALRSPSAVQCIGANAALPVHFEALQHRGARLLSAPALAMRVDFTKAEGLAEGFVSVWESEVVCQERGTVHGILMYWNAYMLPPSLDPLQKLCYSTMPGACNWQDHWQQLVFPLSSALEVCPGDLLQVQLVHDEVNIWASAQKLDERTRSLSGRKRSKDESTKLRTALCKVGEEEVHRPHCSCGWHLLCSPQRLQMLSDLKFNDAWGDVMEQIVARLPASQLLCDLSDGSHLALMAALASKRMGRSALKIVSREKKEFSRLFYQQITDVNDLEDVLMIWDGGDMGEVFEYFAEGEGEMSAAQSLQIGSLVSDCCYYQLHALPTWQALSFFYQRRAFAEMLSSECLIVPAKALINVALIQLQDLSVSHGLVGSVRGFDHSPFDEVQANWHEFTYPYYLANYRKTFLAAPITMAVLDYYALNDEQFNHILQGVAKVTVLGRLDALAIWVDYDLGYNGRVVRQYDEGDFVPYKSQSVKFLPMPRNVEVGEEIVVAMALPQGSSDFQYALL